MNTLLIKVSVGISITQLYALLTELVMTNGYLDEDPNEYTNEELRSVLKSLTKDVLEEVANACLYDNYESVISDYAHTFVVDHGLYDRMDDVTRWLEPMVDEIRAAVVTHNFGNSSEYQQMQHGALPVHLECFFSDGTILFRYTGGMTDIPELPRLQLNRSDQTYLR